jgi:queuine tRNA-ribosyltransferase
MKRIKLLGGAEIGIVARISPFHVFLRFTTQSWNRSASWPFAHATWRSRDASFHAVATQGAVKATTPRELREIGAQIVLANAYHLYLRPGADLVEQFGGLHKFMGWDGPILTDSGGYQVFSLKDLCRVSEEGVHFRSHLDGSAHFLTPENVVRTQEALDVDIAMVLDECVPGPASFAEAELAVGRTTRWAERALVAKRHDKQVLFGIVQGGSIPSCANRVRES